MRIKELIVGLALGTCLLFSSQVSSNDNDIPQSVVEWAQTNVWHIYNREGYTTPNASSFWIDSQHLLTACHVVRSGSKAFIQDLGRHVYQDVEILSCDEETDVALLYCKGCTYPILPTTWYSKELKVGKGVWGAGYPLGFNLVITQGHYQGVHTNNDIEYDIFTAPTINGDSGSPYLTLEEGMVAVAGIRIAVRMENVSGFGYTKQAITHLNSALPTKKILDLLRAKGWNSGN